jgi:hypothetical protein
MKKRRFIAVFLGTGWCIKKQLCLDITVLQKFSTQVLKETNIVFQLNIAINS